MVTYKRARRIALLVTLLLVLVVSLGMTVSAKAKLTVHLSNYWIPDANQTLKNQIQTWANKNNVDVEVEMLSNEAVPVKMATAVETKAGADVAMIQVGMAHRFSEHLLDLSDIATALDKKYGGWFRVARDEAFVNGVWRGVPVATGPFALMYRKSWLDQIGVQPPKTVDDLIDVAGKLKTARGAAVWGEALSHAADGTAFAFSVLWQHGSSFVAEDGKTVSKGGKAVLDSAETAKALDYIQRAKGVLAPGIFGWDNSSDNRGFLSGQLGLIHNGGSVWMAAKDQAPAIVDDIRLAAYPTGPAGSHQLGFVWSYSVLKYTKYPALAKSLVAYLTDPAQSGKWMKAAGNTLVGLLKDSAGHEDRDPFLSGMYAMAPFQRLPGYPGPPTSKSMEVEATYIIVDMMASVAQGTPIAKAIKTAADEVARIYR